MIRNCTLCLAMLLIFCVPAVTAQVVVQPVRFANGDFNTGDNISRQTFNKTSLDPALFNGRYYVLVQFSRLPDTGTRAALQRSGITLEEYIPANAFLSSIDPGFDFYSAAKFSIASINTIPSTYKVDPALYNYREPADKQGIRSFAVSIYPSADVSAAIEALNRAGVNVISSHFRFGNAILVKPDISKLAAIAALPFVSYIREQTIADRIMNYNDIATHGISSLQSVAGRGLSGKGVVVGVGDNADISTHIDFTGKNINRVPYPWDNHGTHTSGTTAGAGFLNPRNKGMAPASHIVSQWFSDVILYAPAYIADYNMVATNNSYYSSAIGCTGNRVYDVLSNYVDAQMTAHDELLHVIAAGNDGGYSCPGYPSSFGTIKSGWQCAKNVITVGAMNQANYTIASFSSKGPAQDGRIKPEIVANGYATLSTYPYDAYQLNYGTSMAAPVLTGVTALLQEAYRKLHSGANAKAALLKALLCNTAEDLGNDGPDYTYGFGMLNARKAVEALEDGKYYNGSLLTTQNNQVAINVPAGARRLKVMLVWADKPATANAAITLVNDLDLSVTTPSLQVRLPLTLDPLQVNNPAVEAADHINNMEQVVIDNPAAGSYNININGFSVPQGPQNYFVTYQVDLNGITVEYPFGGETWVPGETETIRWTAYGNEANTFTVEYSDNNGSSWNSAGAGSTAVDGSARSFNFTVPATANGNYRVRVSRNGTGYTDQSDYSFTVLGQPVVSASVPCEGYAQLNWAAIPSAVSYDVFQLTADSMRLVANTASTGYLIPGLSASATYLFAVSARTATVNGRRSIGVKVTPSSGACSLAGFNNNFKAVSINAPLTGRQFTTGALTASEQVRFTIKNLDNSSSSGSYDLSYQVNGGAVFTENLGTSLAALGTYTHNFTPTAAFATPGLYNIKCWVTKTGDGYPQDDTVWLTVKNLANPPLTLPVIDGFETTTINEYTVNTTGLDGDDRADFKTESNRGRARTFVNSGFAYAGNRAITLDQPGYGAMGTDSLLMTFNLSNYSSNKQLRLDFRFRNHGQQPNPDNKVWIRGGDNQPWVYAYDLVANQGGIGEWKFGLININDIMDTLAVPQTIGAGFQVKIAQQGITSANAPDPVLDQDDGYTIDEVKLSEAIGDVALNEVLSPKKDGCGFSDTHPVTIRLKNYTNSNISNVQVAYRINGGSPVTETIPTLNANQLLTYTFASTANLAPYSDYDFDFWITAAGDNYQGNDSVLNYVFHNSPVISSYPYLEGFEADNGNWYAKGLNASWQWGTPAKALLNKAANGGKAWVTGLTGNYNDNELSYLYSPCFNLSGLTKPMLSFSHIFDIELDYDFTWVEYSTDGVVWKKLGASGSGTNWYDNVTSNNWRVSNSKWHVASIDLPPYAGENIRIRFVMASDGGVNMEGMGIDDVHVFDKAAIYTGTTSATVSQPVSGAGWVDFKSGGKPFVSINPQGQNLGAVIATVYPYAGTSRFSNGQYYLDRNIVVSPANAPAGNIKLRFYFTESEANNLINASGCGTCQSITDAYEPGVDKYSGGTADENGTLDDNLTGFYQFILPDNTEIIPYDNGYYAEFTVNSLSEFWLSRGDIKPPASNTCPGSAFSITSNLTGASYQWQVNNGTGYTDISDGPNYSGTNTSTLQLSGLPTSWSGYSYRCIVDAVNSAETTIRFTVIWTGSAGTDWANPANWNCNILPDQYTDVIIPGNISNSPVISANTEIRSLRVYPGIEVQVRTGVLVQIRGN